MRRWLILGMLAACDGGSVQIVERDPGPDTDDIDIDTDADTEPPGPDFSCEPFGVSIAESATVDHGSLITAMTGPEPVIRPTTISVNSDAECAFDLRQGFVAANIDVGPSGYPDVVICTGRGSDLDGEEGILDDPVQLATPRIPASLPDSSGDKTMEWGDTARFIVDRRLESLTVRTNAELTIDGDIDLHVTGDVEFNRGRLVLTPGSELDLWVDGRMDALWESRLNVEGDPGALRIHLTGRSTMSLDQRSAVSARVRAPESGLVVKGRGATLVGTVQAASLDLVWGGNILVPDALICTD